MFRVFFILTIMPYADGCNGQLWRSSLTRTVAWRLCRRDPRNPRDSRTSRSGRLRYRLGEKRMTPDPVQQRFTAALDALIEQVKQDRSILAAILCGSLSHDTVWAKSDIDLALVTIDDRKVESGVRLALCGRRQRACVPDAAGASSARRSRARCTTRSCTRCSPRGGCSTRTTRRSPISAPGCTQIGERDTQVQLLRAATQRAAGRSTRRTNGSSPAATSTTPRCGFSTRRRRWRRSR